MALRGALGPAAAPGVWVGNSGQRGDRSGNGEQEQGGNWAQVARGSCPQSTCPSFPSVTGGQVFSVRQCQGQVVLLTQPPDPLLTSLSRENTGQS